MRILLTTTSDQDTPGAHHQTLEDSGSQVVRGRGPLNEAEMLALVQKYGGYGTDVVNVEPLKPPHPYLGVDNIMLTPHIGSRTVESVGRQAMRATLNLVKFLKGDADFIQANKF